MSGSIDAARAHDLLGHSHEDSTKETARYLGWNVKRAEWASARVVLRQKPSKRIYQKSAA